MKSIINTVSNNKKYFTDYAKDEGFGKIIGVTKTYTNTFNVVCELGIMTFNEDTNQLISVKEIKKV